MITPLKKKKKVDENTFIITVQNITASIMPLISVKKI